jgi:L-asparaginase II
MGQSVSAEMPVLVEITRGPMVESRHRGAVAVVDAKGGIVHQIGDIDRLTYARSAIKPLQAVPLMETGAADHFNLGDDQIALACASHRGEPEHVALVAAWLERIGLSENDLECGVHAPGNESARAALIRQGRAPSQLHNNCSGKHAGFLTTARHMGEPTKDYIAPDHPVQRRVSQALSEISGCDLSNAPLGRDGCGIPVIGVPLRGLALAMARFADPRGLPAQRQASVRRVFAAMTSRPFLVDGTNTMTTRVMELTGGSVALKPGAEGVYCAALPEQGLGIALKIEDGAGRASEFTIATVLDRLGVFTPPQRGALASYLTARVYNVAGVETGHYAPGAALDSLKKR